MTEYRLYQKDGKVMIQRWNDEYKWRDVGGLVITKLSAGDHLTTQEFDDLIDSIPPDFCLNKLPTKGQFH